MMLPSTNFLECLQVETVSFHLLRVDNAGLKIIKNFSLTQRLHLLLEFEYAVLLFKIDHLIVKLVL